MAPSRQYASYSKSKAGRRRDVAEMAAADRAAATYYARQTAPMEGIDYPMRYPAPPRNQSYVAQRARGEVKYFDVGINAAVTTAGTTWADTEVPADNYVNSSGSHAGYTDSCLIPTAQGSGYGQVNGNKYLLKTLRVKGSLSVGTFGSLSTAQPTIPVRLVLVMDNMPSGTQAQGEDVFQDFGNTPENAYSFLRMAAGGGRYTILKDKIVNIQPTIAVNDATAGTVSVGFSQPHFKFAVKPNKEVQIKTGNATPTIAGTVNCNIFLLAYAYIGSAAQAVTIQACSRAYYVD